MSQIPAEWKLANIIPIHKKGKKTTLKITTQSPCYPSYARLLNVSFSTTHLNTYNLIFIQHNLFR